MLSHSWPDKRIYLLQYMTYILLIWPTFIWSAQMGYILLSMLDQMWARKTCLVQQRATTVAAQYSCNIWSRCRPHSGPNDCNSSFDLFVCLCVSSASLDREERSWPDPDSGPTSTSTLHSFTFTAAAAAAAGVRTRADWSPACEPVQSGAWDLFGLVFIKTNKAGGHFGKWLQPRGAGGALLLWCGC